MDREKIDKLKKEINTKTLELNTLMIGRAFAKDFDEYFDILQEVGHLAGSIKNLRKILHNQR